MAYNYIATLQKSSAVAACITGNFTSPTDLNLLVAKVSRLEMYLVTPEGLRPMKEVGLYGRVAKMKLFRPPYEKKDLVFILTVRYNAMILEWRTGDNGELEVVTRAHGNVSDRTKPSENGILAVIDPQARVIGLRLYDGLFKIIPIEKDSSEMKPFNCRLELNINDVEFLDGCDRPTLIFIHEQVNHRHVQAYEINVDDKEFARTVWEQDKVEIEASILIPIPSPPGGAIVIGKKSIVYHDIPGGHNNVSVTPPQMKEYPISCYCRVNTRGLRYLLGDIAGRLFMLLLELQDKMDGSQAVKDLKVELLGDIPIPECMTYLDNGVVFVGSRLGDSALVRLAAARDEAAQYVQPMETFTSLAPIVDMCVVDLERQGQNQLITCSGENKMGSISVITNRVEFKEQAFFNMPGIKGMWALTLAEGSSYHDTLVLAFTGQTCTLRFNGAVVEEVEIKGFTYDRQTFLAGNVCHNQLIQVTDAGISLISPSPEGWALVASWSAGAPGAPVVACCGTRCVYAAGARIYLVKLGRAQLTTLTEVRMEEEVACLDLGPGGDDGLLGVGLWTNMSVKILKLPDLRPLHTEKLSDEVIPRSLLICTLEGVCYLLCALGDGSMFYFTVDPQSGALSNRKKVTLGTQPTVLRSFRSCIARTYTTNILACSDRHTIIVPCYNKLILVDVKLEGVTLMYPLNAAAYPDSVVLATDSTVSLGSFAKDLNIKTVRLGETPRRLAYQEVSQTFGVTSMRTVKQAQATPGFELDAEQPATSASCTEPITEQPATSAGCTEQPATSASYTEQPATSASYTEQPATSASYTEQPATSASYTSPLQSELHSLLIIDQHTFEVLHAHQLLANEFALSLVSCKLGDDPNHYYAVGTAVLNPEESEPKQGRILLFYRSEGKLVQVAEKEIKGCCYTLVEFNGKLLAAINHTVRLFEWTSEKELRLECSHFNNIVALYLKVKGDFILVGDLMRSMSLLQYKQMEGSFKEIAREYSPNWMTAVEILDDDTFLGAENRFNLFVCQKDSAAPTDEDTQDMEYTGQFHLGDMVNVMRAGSLVATHADTAAPVSAPVLLATVTGAICLVVQLTQELFEFLSQLQERLTHTIKSVGKVPHSFWRSFNTDVKTEPAEGFIDGDLVESFLDLSRDMQQETVHGLQICHDEGNREATVDDVVSILHALSWMH